MVDEKKTPLNKIILLASDEKVETIVRAMSSSCEVYRVDSEEKFEEEFEEYDDTKFALAICGPKLGLDFSFEVAQIFNNQCPQTPSFFVTHDRESFEEKTMIKNGFDQAFLLPLDREILDGTIAKSLSPEALNQRNYKIVKVVDFQPDTVLEFDTYVFLPLNNKYVKFSSASQKLSESKLEKLKTNNSTNLFIDQADSEKFYDYTAEHLAELAKGTDPLSATERDEKLKSSIRDLFIDIFDHSIKSDFDSGKEKIISCQKIISSYITNGDSTNWYSQLINTIGGSTGNYAHASEVSTIAALIAIGLKLENVDDLAMAGFLHDISLADFPSELLEKSQEEWPQEDLERYKAHAISSINLLKSRRMLLSQPVETAILQHHEMYSGKGFPKGIVADGLTNEAQILILADNMQYLMVKKEGKPALTPLQAVERVQEQRFVGPELISKVKNLLKSSAQE